jgi:hypothetical protein
MNVMLPRWAHHRWQEGLHQAHCAHSRIQDGLQSSAVITSCSAPLPMLQTSASTEQRGDVPVASRHRACVRSLANVMTRSAWPAQFRGGGGASERGRDR